MEKNSVDMDNNTLLKKILMGSAEVLIRHDVIDSIYSLGIIEYNPLNNTNKYKVLPIDILEDENLILYPWIKRIFDKSTKILNEEKFKRANVVNEYLDNFYEEKDILKRIMKISNILKKIAFHKPITEKLLQQKLNNRSINIPYLDLELYSKSNEALTDEVNRDEQLQWELGWIIEKYFFKYNVYFNIFFHDEVKSKIYAIAGFFKDDKNSKVLYDMTMQRDLENKFEEYLPFSLMQRKEAQDRNNVYVSISSIDNLINDKLKNSTSITQEEINILKNFQMNIQNEKFDFIALQNIYKQYINDGSISNIISIATKILK